VTGLPSKTACSFGYRDPWLLRAGQLLDQGIDGGVCDLVHLVVGAVLDGVGRKDASARMTQRSGLGLGGIDEAF